MLILTNTFSALGVFYEKDERENRASERCWSGIEEKMPEILTELN